MIELFIQESQFNPGGRFAGQDKAKTKVVVNDYSPSDGFAFKYIIGINPIHYEDIEFDKAFRGNRSMLCSIVQKGIVKVRHDGTELTPQQIRDFSA